MHIIVCKKTVDLVHIHKQCTYTRTCVYTLTGFAGNGLACASELGVRFTPSPAAAWGLASVLGVRFTPSPAAAWGLASVLGVRFTPSPVTFDSSALCTSWSWCAWAASWCVRERVCVCICLLFPLHCVRHGREASWCISKCTHTQTHTMSTRHTSGTRQIIPVILKNYNYMHVIFENFQLHASSPNSLCTHTHIHTHSMHTYTHTHTVSTRHILTEAFLFFSQNLHLHACNFPKLSRTMCSNSSCLCM